MSIDPKRSSNDPVDLGVTYQRKLFALMEEFFRGATGQSVEEFSTIESFDQTVRERAEELAHRSYDPYNDFARRAMTFYKVALPSLAGTNSSSGVAAILARASFEQ